MNLILTGSSLFVDRDDILVKYLSIHPYREHVSTGLSFNGYGYYIVLFPRNLSTKKNKKTVQGNKGG